MRNIATSGFCSVLVYSQLSPQAIGRSDETFLKTLWFESLFLDIASTYKVVSSCNA